MTLKFYTFSDHHNNKMPNKCCALYGCSAKINSKKSKGVSFFSWSKNDQQQKKKWSQIILKHRQPSADNNLKDRLEKGDIVICQNHFLETDYFARGWDNDGQGNFDYIFNILKR